MQDETRPEEIEEKLRDRPDLFERLHKGDTTALIEMLQEGTQSEIANAKIRELA